VDGVAEVESYVSGIDIPLRHKECLMGMLFYPAPEKKKQRGVCIRNFLQQIAP